MSIIRKCLTCGNEFQTQPCKIKVGKGKYCSVICRTNASIKNRFIYCITCKRKFRTTPYRIKIGVKKYCSLGCYHKLGKCNPHWNGGKRKGNGYIQLLIPAHPFRSKQNYVFEHRLVIEKCIWRYLKHKEVVHHIGNKYDNRPHMLMAFCCNAAHRRFHGNPSNVKPEEIIFDGRHLNLSTRA